MTPPLFLEAIPQPSLVPSAPTPSEPSLPMVLLSAIVWVPAIVAVVLLLFPSRTDAQKDRIRTGALGATATVLALVLVLWFGFREQFQQFAYEEKRDWIRGFGASYHLGVDGISLPFVLLSGILFFVAVLASWRVRDRVKEYFVLLLVVETGVNGVFASLDYLLFFIFWEIGLIPMFFLIGLWGGPRRLYAAWKFLLFTISASAVMLLAIVIMYLRAPQRTFDMVTLHDVQFPAAVATLVFWLFFITFAVWIGAVPLHTWLPDAHVEAPTPVSVILAGAVLKLGGYGLYRVNVGQFASILHTVSTVILVIALISVFWGALAALAQDDMKRMVAYSSVTSMGFVVLAVAATAQLALDGGLLMMFAHGLIIALLFLLVEAIADRTGTRSIRALSGLAVRMPRTAILFSLAALAAFGLPGLASFMAQFMIFVGAYPVHRTGTSIAVLGVLLLTGVLLWTIQRVFFGSTPDALQRVKDVGTVELTYSSMLLFVVVLLGVLPGMLMDGINSGVLSLLVRGGT